MTLSELTKMAQKAYGDHTVVDYLEEDFPAVLIVSSSEIKLEINDDKALEMAAAALKAKLPGRGRPKKNG